jgi:hypothetical protein
MAQKKAGRSAFRVEFDFSESSFRFKHRYDSLAAFDADLRTAALLAPRDGSYDKTYYKVVHVPTGDVWDARLDIQHPSEHGGKALSVAARIESYCKHMLASKRRPTEEQAEAYRRWLERIRRSAR